MVGVLAVPGQAAQGVADDLVEAGVKIIFNYSEALLQTPPARDGPHLEPRRRPALRALLLPHLDPCSTWPGPGRSSRPRRTSRSAVEEEFQLLDPETLVADPALHGAARGDRRRPGAGRRRRRRADRVGDRDPLGPRRELGRRGRAPARGRAQPAVPHRGRDRASLLGATGTHPWSPWQEQKIIDTEHYRRVADGLKYVAWRNNTFGIHVHVGIRGADRAIAVCDRLRPLHARAAGASPPTRRSSTAATPGLHSARTPDLHEELPALRDPRPLRQLRRRTPTTSTSSTRAGSIVEATQIWWSIRPHHSFGTVELRICDAQTSGDESIALAGLLIAAIAQAALDEDEGVPFDAAPAAPDRGELLARDPLRARRQDDRPRAAARSTRPRRCPTGCCSGRRPRARRSASTSRSRPRTAPSASGARSRRVARSRRSSPPRWS